MQSSFRERSVAFSGCLLTRIVAAVPVFRRAALLALLIASLSGMGVASQRRTTQSMNPAYLSACQAVGLQSDDSSVYGLGYANGWLLCATADAFTGSEQLLEETFVGSGSFQLVEETGGAYTASSLTALYSVDSTSAQAIVNAVSSYAPTPFTTTAVSIGPDGTLWVIGGYAPSVNNIYVATATTAAEPQTYSLAQVSGAASLIAVDWAGAPYVVNASDSIFHWNSSSDSFGVIGGAATAIATGPGGAMWVIGTGGGVYDYTGAGFNQSPGAGTEIAVATNGLPWVINSQGAIYEYTSATTAVQIPGAASEIAIGYYGGIWCLGTDNNYYGHSIYQYGSSGFQQVAGQATQIAVDQNGAAWVINSQGALFQFNASTAAFQPITLFQQ